MIETEQNSEVKTGTLQLKSALTVHWCVLIFLHTVPVNTLETDASALTAVHHAYLRLTQSCLTSCSWCAPESALRDRCHLSVFLSFPVKHNNLSFFIFQKKNCSAETCDGTRLGKKKKKGDLLIASKNGVNMHTMLKHTGWDGVNNWCPYL